MQIIAAHRKRVTRLRRAMERLLELELAVHDARSESWRLQTHHSPQNEVLLKELRARMAETEAEIAALARVLAGLAPEPEAGEPQAAAVPAAAAG